ncbi:MAG: ChaN family lipoprotein [Pseudomonadota bacterium]
MLLTLCMCALPVAAPVAASASQSCPKTPGAICAGDEAINYETLVERLKAADIALLGERHDNPIHHEWQARLTADLAPAGLAFEMVPQDLEDYANAARLNGDDLEEALEWEARGWPDFAMYLPIFEAAPEAWVAGGGVAPDVLRLSVKEGAAVAWPEGAERYGLNERLPEEVMKAMIKEQDVAHCGALPTGMLPGMVEAQQLRDAAFADAVIRLIEDDHAPVALITGNGHARTDRGVPLYLNRAAPERTALAVGMIEVAADGSFHEAPYDFAIYTEPFDRGDPCEAFIKKRQRPNSE